jgi:hypothetical protein
MSFNLGIGPALAGEAAAVLKANRQAIIDKVSALGDAGLTAADNDIKAVDHIPIVGSIINAAVDKFVAGEEALLPAQLGAGLDAVIALLERDAGQG